MQSTAAPSDLDRHEIPQTNSASRFGPLLARTRTTHHPVGPVAYDCVKLIFVRAGSALFFSEFGERPVKVGDVVLLGANTLCGAEPEDWVTVTTLYLDRDYVVDQVFWQHAAVLTDRLAAKDFIAARYAEPGRWRCSTRNTSPKASPPGCAGRRCAAARTR